MGDEGSLDATGAKGVAADSSGNLIVAGITSASGFPTKNAFQPQLGGGLDCASDSGQAHFCADGFLTKFSPDGRTLIFSTYYGGSLDDFFYPVPAGCAGRIYSPRSTRR